MSGWRVWQLVGWLVPDRRSAPDQRRQLRPHASPRGSRSLFTSPTHGVAPTGEDPNHLRRSLSCLEQHPDEVGFPANHAAPANPATLPNPAAHNSPALPTSPAVAAAPAGPAASAVSTVHAAPAVPAAASGPEEPSGQPGKRGTVTETRQVSSSATLPRASSRRRSLPVSSEDDDGRHTSLSRRMSVQSSGRRHPNPQGHAALSGSHTWTRNSTRERLAAVTSGMGGKEKAKDNAQPDHDNTRTSLSLHLTSNGLSSATSAHGISRSDSSAAGAEGDAAFCRLREAVTSRASTAKTTKSPLSPLALPTTTSAAIAAAAASLRSNLKPKSQLRRRRSDSGHSVTFDLPEDCDNLGTARVVRSDAEPLSKCMKDHQNMREQSGARDRRRHGDDPHDEVLTWLSAGDVGQGLAERAPTPGVGLEALSVSINRDDSARSPVWPKPTLPEVAAMAVLSPGLGESAVSPCGPLSDKTTSPVPPLQPPTPTPQHSQASLEWSSTDSGGPDSGYWGAGEAPVATRRGVKVVSRGRELLLPYACLHRGRLHLRIVRGESAPSGCLGTLREPRGVLLLHVARIRQRLHTSLLPPSLPPSLLPSRSLYSLYLPFPPFTFLSTQPPRSLPFTSPRAWRRNENEKAQWTIVSFSFSSIGLFLLL
ncbi:uncharacterized protein LOC135115093 [Scylla paramamosain]|uniref:uncharacterized protein LOC135115093 n=1 Tax=Scylla paramamosain TaxID=85552 RepID=UPI003082B6F0